MGKTATEKFEADCAALFAILNGMETDSVPSSIINKWMPGIKGAVDLLEWEPKQREYAAMPRDTMLCVFGIEAWPDKAKIHHES